MQHSSLSSDRSRELLSQEAPIPANPVQFKFVDLYTTFEAEYVTNEDGDITIHFFLPAEEGLKGLSPKYKSALFAERYWKSIVPQKLDATARSYFHAEYPRLQAQHVPGVLRANQVDINKSEDSWWFKAHGFNVLEIEGLIHGFLAAFDKSLEDFLIEETSRT